MKQIREDELRQKGARPKDKEYEYGKNITKANTIEVNYQL